MSEEGRRMIYPITLPQKIKHFPYKFIWNHLPRFKFVIASVFLSIPIFYSLQKLSYSPSNVQKYEEYLRKEEIEHKKHLHHLEGYYGEGHH